MIPSLRLRQSSAWLLAFISITVMFTGCSKVPRHFLRMADTDATLTDLIVHPETYRDKVVILGGTLIEEDVKDQHLWLRLKNRPLDQDYVPHRPVDTESPEGGSYWVMVMKDNLPPTYQKWARMTVVGRVTGAQRLETEPVLTLLYVRGWGMSGAHDGIWNSLSDTKSAASVPAGIGGEFSGGMR
jgi:starvation-inducible outer membrane lipoprotein